MMNKILSKMKFLLAICFSSYFLNFWVLSSSELWNRSIW